MSSLAWRLASDELPDENTRVLIIPARNAKRQAHIGTLVKGDPARDGLFYANDRWQIDGDYTTAALNQDDLWARIEPPDLLTSERGAGNG